MDGPVIRTSGKGVPVVVLACVLAWGLCGCRTNRDALHREQFTATDTDRDGFVDETEFEKARSTEATDQADKQFSKADADHDQRLSYEEFVTTLHKPHPLLWALGVFSAVSFVGSLVAIPLVVARLPVDHFVAPHEAADWVTSSVARRLWLVLKNLFGILLIAGGIIMLVLPGQGVLTILLGVAIMDLPGKWRVMRALARRPEVMKALNWMRERAQKPPLTPPPHKGDSQHEISQPPVV
jgi:hypothetical protein